MKCIICNSNEQIENHHIVPKCYKNYFPIDNRTIPLCKKPCHYLMPPFMRSSNALELNNISVDYIKKMVKKLNKLYILRRYYFRLVIRYPKTGLYIWYGIGMYIRTTNKRNPHLRKET